MRHWRVSEAARRDARTISPRAQSAQAALYHELKRQFNVTTNLELEYGPHGLGLFAPLGGSALATDTSPALLLRVPQGLALSPSISGCRGYSDAPASLRRLLSDGALPWEVTVGSLLLWACSSQRPPTDFYPQYRRLLPDADDQTSLLLFSAQELQQLQDPSLAAEAEAWQQEVAEAYCRHVQGNAALAADCGRGGGGGGSGPGGASQQAHLDLEDFFWAVATTESRAFGFEGAGGGAPSQQLQAFVPFFDLANHAPRAPTSHVISAQHASVDLLFHPPRPATSKAATTAATAASFDAAVAVSCDGGGGGIGGGTSNDGDTAGVVPSRSSLAAPSDSWSFCGYYAPGSEIRIDYGSKSNRQLMAQYGFVVPGNPFDARLLLLLPEGRSGDKRGGAAGGSADFRQQLGGPHRLRREALARAVAEVAAAVEQAGAGSVWIRVSQCQRSGVALSSAAATAAVTRRLQAVEASVQMACGWRNMHEYRTMTGPASDAICGAALRDWARRQLSALPTSLHDDLLMSQPQADGAAAAFGGGGGGDGGGGGGGGSVSSAHADMSGASRAGRIRARAALQYRVERKALLHTLELVAERLVYNATAACTATA